MAAATATPSPNPTQKRNVSRRIRAVGRRRRAGEEDISEGGANSAVELVNDDSLTEGSIASDEQDAVHDSDTSNVDDASPTVPAHDKRPVARTGGGQGNARGNGATGGSALRTPANAADSPVDAAAKASSTSAPSSQPQSTAPSVKQPQPAIVSSSSVQPPRRETAYDRQRREHDLYKQRRDEDPSFVPNRGAFFMHDHRGAGPAANGFRPFGRPGRGGRRGGFGGSFSPMHNQFHNQADPIASQPWTHDMHEAVTQPNPSRLSIPRRQNYDAVNQYANSQYAGSQYAESQYAGSQYAGSQYAGSQYGGSQFGGTRVPPPVTVIPTCPPSSTPINRSMSVEKPLGIVTVRVFFPPMKEPAFFEKFKAMQYTKLPDHRPPLRRDKAVVIDLPGHPKRQIFPAVDRSFIFIPRALRPNQQRTRGGRNKSVMGSVSGFSRRTSVFGGSYYNGSMYSPSVALSRRSSIAQDTGRDFIISPAGSVISRPPMAMENTARPVVRLPPAAGPPVQPVGMPVGIPVAAVPGPMIVPAMELAPIPMPSYPQQQPPYAPLPAAPAVNPQPNQQPSQGPPPSPSRPSSQKPGQSQPAPPAQASEESQPPQPPQPTQSSQPSQTSQQSQPSQPSQPSQSHQPSETSSLSSVPPPQHHPLPQKPTFQENRPSLSLPMHQPRPQKAVSVENIESPAALGAMQPSAPQPYSMAFHQQVPISMPSGYPPAESHSRHPSYQSHTTGTPLSQIPERAIHAAPFQPNMPGQQQMSYPQQNNIGTPGGPAYYAGAPGSYVMQPAQQQGYYYATPTTYSSTMPSGANMPGFVPGGAPQGPVSAYGQPGQVDASGGASAGPRNMVAQEVNGMVYYVDASQMPSVPTYPGYAQAPAPQGGYMSSMGSMVTPAPAEGYYYGGQPGMMYYPQ
ncbi:hypothetical protein HMPREF1624_01325 [Sporothrix schenckii ATCC 58251]|uniref:Btz domain-containing protein n=1 Tax=Sporothrix schenckii (strain ATCC 58251 / de Perez 2211183) TaxID=1391915 RepID=U7Q8E3_SPOS1|nr:hypothetical protein HMPREF1624_01325 [Sporothrix schenckii ATCC 58251]